MKVKPGCLITAVAASLLSIAYLVYLLQLRKGFGVVRVNSPRISSRKIYYDSSGMHTEELMVAEIALSESSEMIQNGHPDVTYMVEERYTNSMSSLQISYPDTIKAKLERATALSQDAAHTRKVEDAYTQKSRISQETTLTSYDVATTTLPLTNSLSVSTPTLIPFMGNYNCTDDLCSQFVLHGSSCGQSAHRFVRKKNCHFMNGTNRAPVALASFPGSGNTWVRGLLEQATGICTGSVYCDGYLQHTGFTGEGMNNAAVIAVKTHNFNTDWKRKNYGSAILILRNPFDALVAEWSRQRTGSHVREPPDQIFGENKRWNSFIADHLGWWVPYFRTWYINGTSEGNPVLVVRFEDIKNNSIVYIKKMLRFLHFPYSDDRVQKRMEGFEGRFGEKFHRKHKNDSSDHFTREQRDKVISCIQTAVELLQQENNGETFGIEDYLLHQ